MEVAGPASSSEPSGQARMPPGSMGMAGAGRARERLGQG